MSFDPRLPNCFDERNLVFAEHPFDKDGAFEWLAALRQERAAWTTVSRQIREFLTEKGVAEDHIAQQLQRAAHLLEPWLQAPESRHSGNVPTRDVSRKT